MKMPGVWMVTLPPMTVETKCSVEVREEAGAAINIQDVNEALTHPVPPLLNLLPLQGPDRLLLHPHLDHVPPLHALEPEREYMLKALDHNKDIYLYLSSSKEPSGERLRKLPVSSSDNFNSSSCGSYL